MLTERICKRQKLLHLNSTENHEHVAATIALLDIEIGRLLTKKRKIAEGLVGTCDDARGSADF